MLLHIATSATMFDELTDHRLASVFQLFAKKSYISGHYVVHLFVLSTIVI
jgi:hypothetical protein